ncbi:unnamed protein product [Ilex paraguariensis]|uniref:Uncharacterized protein n=1 Tax=Ilex paraguariensis TaxID=185542 RepID=A0ABC8S9N2_9AQUA
MAQARKLLSIQKDQEVPSADGSLVLVQNVLPKGSPPPPPSSPLVEGHAVAINGRLFTVEVARADRFLESVPSPSIGH